MEILLTYIPLAIIITSVIGFIFMNRKNSKKRTSLTKDAGYMQREEDAQVEYGRLINLFEMLSKFPLTSKGTNQLHELIASLGVYTIVEQRVETARLQLTSYIILIVSTVLVYFITDSTILRVGAVIVALVFRRDFINKKLRKERLELWEDVYRSCVSLKNEYERVYSVPKAFTNATVEEKAVKIFANISALFKSKNASADLAYFNQNNPNQILQRLAHLAYNSFYYGVAVSPLTQIDTFITNIDSIMSDLQVEIDEAKKEKKKFYVAEKLPLAALVIIAVVPSFMTSTYPGMHYFYTGVWGQIFLIVSVLAIIVGYHVATNLNESDRPIDDTFSFEVRLFLKPKFKDFWERRIPKFNHGDNDLLRESLSYLSAAQLRFRRMYTSLIFGFIVLALTFAYVFLVQKTSVVDLSAFPDDIMQTINKNYDSPDDFAKKYVLDMSISDEAMMKEELAREGLNTTGSTLELLSTILMENREVYQDATYKAWYLFLVLAAMIVGYSIPTMLLKRRKKLVAVDVQYEILVLYAVVVQMMYTPLKLRDYLKQFVYISKLYPKTHLDCYINQFNRPHYIKERAADMINPMYFDLMEKLYTIRSDKIPEEVFRELEKKREYLYNNVLAMREHKFNNNYTILRALSVSILLGVVLLMVVLPLGMFAFQALKQYGGLV